MSPVCGLHRNVDKFGSHRSARKDGLAQLLWWVEIYLVPKFQVLKVITPNLIYYTYIITDDNPVYIHPCIHLALHLVPSTPGRSPGNAVRGFAKRIGEGARGPTSLFSFRSSGWSACMTPIMRNNTMMLQVATLRFKTNGDQSEKVLEDFATKVGR